MSKKAITIVSIFVVVIVIVIGIGISIAKADVTEVSVVEVSASSVHDVLGNVYEVVPHQVAYEFAVCPVEKVTLVDSHTARVTVMRGGGATGDGFSAQENADV